MKNKLFPRFIRLDGTAARVRIPVLRHLFNTEAALTTAAAASYAALTLATVDSPTAPLTAAFGAACVGFNALCFGYTRQRILGRHFDDHTRRHKIIDTRPLKFGQPTDIADSFNALHACLDFKRHAHGLTAGTIVTLCLAQALRLTPMTNMQVNALSAAIIIAGGLAIASHALPARRLYKIATGQWTLRTPQPADTITAPVAATGPT